jgi:hypothetical protein
MNEFKHWLDPASDADELERSILRAGSEADPTDAQRREVWAGLALALAPLAGAGATMAQGASVKATASAATKAAGVWLSVGKGFVLGLAMYGASAGVSEIASRVAEHRAPRAGSSAHQLVVERPRTIAAAAPALSATAPVAPLPEAASHATSRPSAAAELKMPAAAPPATPNEDLPPIGAFSDLADAANGTRASQLDAETRALRSARTELRAGKLVDAFATLEASRRRFSAPALYQEREALMIELLYRSGQTAAAQARAAAFLARFPESPHAEQVRQFAAH